MKKIYLVIRDYSCADNGTIGENEIRVFKKRDKAQEYFEKMKKQIISFNTGYNNIESEKDYYCESEEGEYSYYHELVYIEEKEVE